MVNLLWWVQRKTASVRDGRDAATMRTGRIPDPQNRMYKDSCASTRSTSSVKERPARGACCFGVSIWSGQDTESKTSGGLRRTFGDFAEKVSAGGKGCSSIRQETESEVGWVFCETGGR